MGGHNFCYAWCCGIKVCKSLFSVLYLGNKKE